MGEMCRYVLLEVFLVFQLEAAKRFAWPIGRHITIDLPAPPHAIIRLRAITAPSQPLLQ